MAEQVTIAHPDIEGTGTVMRSSLRVWEAKGWSEVEGQSAQEEQLPAEKEENDSQPTFDFSNDQDDTEDDVADE